MKRRLKLVLSGMLILQALVIGQFALDVGITGAANRTLTIVGRDVWLPNYEWLTRCSLPDVVDDLNDMGQAGVSLLNCQVQPWIWIPSLALGLAGIAWMVILIKDRRKKTK